MIITPVGVIHQAEVKHKKQSLTVKNNATLQSTKTVPCKIAMQNEKIENQKEK